MGRFDEIKNKINANINENGEQRITGQVLNEVLIDEVNTIDEAITELEESIGQGGGGGTGGVAELMTELTYDELVSLRDSNSLVKGMKYRITDYETMTSQANTQSAGHPFDIIVTALDEKNLDEKASAIWSARDVEGYFSNSNLPAWDVRYCLDNDGDRFGWAVTPRKIIAVDFSDFGLSDLTIGLLNGTFDYNGDTYVRWDASIFDMECFILTDNENPSSEDIPILYMVSEGGGLQGGQIVRIEEYTDRGKGVIYQLIDDLQNNCPYDFKNIMFLAKLTDEGKYDLENGLDYYVYTFDCYNSDGIHKDYTMLDSSLCKSNYIASCRVLPNNMFLNVENAEDAKCENNILMHGCVSNIFGNGCYNNTLGCGCFGNIWGDNCCKNTLGDDCYNNYFANDCISNTLGKECNDNFFESAFCFNILGDLCRDNIFGDSAIGNILGNQCHSNTFGDRAFYNTLEVYCYTNRFGNNCEYNKLANNSVNNEFGNECLHNTLGNGCSQTTFGDNCTCNTLEDKCYNNKFGSYCYHNTLKKECSDIVFGADSLFYARYNVLNSNTQYIKLVAEKGTEYIQNYTISCIPGGTYYAPKEITVVRGRDYETFVTSNAAGEITEYTIDDIINK